jgi:FMN phosphatase YigB (HAD superfamily)
MKLVTFDAFSTLFCVSPLPGRLYWQLAKKHGYLHKILGDDSKRLDGAFANAIRHCRLQYPNYGLSNQMTSSEWWRRVVEKTLPPGTVSPVVDAVWRDAQAVYAGKDGYRIYPDTLPTLNALHRADIQLGVISNCDERLDDILKAMGLRDYFDFVLDSRS